jgi:hypothetical protein
MNGRLVSLACLTLVLLAVVAHAEVWNLADDYSIAQNPNGAWSYGWRTHSGDALVLYTGHTHRCGAPGDLQCWNYYVQDYCPLVARNVRDYSVPCDNTAFRPHKVYFHPGPNQQSVVRWTAPAAMLVALAVRFEPIDVGTSIMHIFHEGASLFSMPLDGPGPVVDITLEVACNAGDVIDFAIEPVSFYADSTQLEVVIDSQTVSVAEQTWGHVKALYR